MHSTTNPRAPSELKSNTSIEKYKNSKISKNMINDPISNHFNLRKSKYINFHIGIVQGIRDLCLLKNTVEKSKKHRNFGSVSPRRNGSVSKTTVKNGSIVYDGNNDLGESFKMDQSELSTPKQQRLKMVWVVLGYIQNIVKVQLFS